MTFPRYPEYKDSGVEWLGEVPVHWGIVALKRVATIRYGIGEPPVYRMEGVPLVRATNIHHGVISTDGMVFVDPDDIPEKRIVWLEAGDIVVVRSGAYTGDSAIIPDKYGPAIAGFDMVVRCQGVCPSFAQFALLSTPVKEGQIDLLRMRAAQPHLNAEELGGVALPVPAEREEQVAITSFLDHETSKIDALIAEQQNLISLLNEKRQAVISHAVTKGLNPDVPMKDSGVEWLGEVPEHWNIIPLKRVSLIRYGIGEPPAYQPEGVPLIRATNVSRGVVTPEGMVFVNPDDIPRQRILWLRGGDIVVVRSGAYTGDSAIIPDEYGPAIAGFDMVVRCHGVAPKFVGYGLLSAPVKEGQIDLFRMRAAQPHLNAEELGSVVIAVPRSRDEQSDIVEFLDCETANIDTLITEGEHSIELLLERRSALISAAVTGKIDVRSRVAQEAA